MHYDRLNQWQKDFSMRITALKEADNETRVAITPLSAKNCIKMGLEVAIEKSAGLASGFSDSLYKEAGAEIAKNAKELKKITDILLCVNEPTEKTLQGLPDYALVVGHIDNSPDSPLIQWCMKQKISLLSMSLIPRISRAQSMDSLSSQANLAGYRSVLEGINHFQKVVPMMMTAAGMIQPAKILILGAGVAGLQAIATAKRLGAVVYAFDVRRQAKEQVESLGAEFIEVPLEEQGDTQSGYASEMSEGYKKQQADLIDEYARQSDIVITTALIPGRKAPILLHKETIAHMKPGSVIVDLAASRGGNCELSEANKIIRHGEVTLIGLSNMAGLVATTASELYANNLVHLLKLLIKNVPPQIYLNPEDDIIQQAILCHNGTYMPFKNVVENQHA